MNRRSLAAQTRAIAEIRRLQATALEAALASASAVAVAASQMTMERRVALQRAESGWRARAAAPFDPMLDRAWAGAVQAGDLALRDAAADQAAAELRRGLALAEAQRGQAQRDAAEDLALQALRHERAGRDATAASRAADDHLTRRSAP